MPFSKSKPGRKPLQRLNDQRRRLALVGLAVGAVAAAVFRRKRRGGEAEAEFVAPMPPVAPPAAQPESGLPAAVEVPPAASEPVPTAAPAPGAPAVEELNDEGSTADETVEETAINAPAPSAEPTGGTPAPNEPATGELSAEEASILAVLAQSGRSDDDRTAIAVATSLERETTDVASVLRKLGAEGVVAGELYTAVGDKIWAVTERGVRRLGAQS
jgi:hypothetical protein